MLCLIFRSVIFACQKHIPLWLNKDSMVYFNTMKKMSTKQEKMTDNFCLDKFMGVKGEKNSLQKKPSRVFPYC